MNKNDMSDLREKKWVHLTKTICQEFKMRILVKNRKIESPRTQDINKKELAKHTT
jgi:hypothetical protein